MVVGSPTNHYTVEGTDEKKMRCILINLTSLFSFLQVHPFIDLVHIYIEPEKVVVKVKKMLKRNDGPEWWILSSTTISLRANQNYVPMETRQAQYEKRCTS